MWSTCAAISRRPTRHSIIERRYNLSRFIPRPFLGACEIADKPLLAFLQQRLAATPIDLIPSPRIAMQFLDNDLSLSQKFNTCPARLNSRASNKRDSSEYAATLPLARKLLRRRASRRRHCLSRLSRLPRAAA